MFRSEGKADKWIVDINYESLDTANCLQDGLRDVVVACGNAKGTITFINSQNENEKIEFNFDDVSRIGHYVSDYDIPVDDIQLNIDLNGKKASISLSIMYDQSQNPIVLGMAIDSENMDKITDNKHFVDYDHLKLDASLIYGPVVPQDVEVIKNHIDDCRSDILFTTDYYYNNLSDFNPWHI